MNQVSFQLKFIVLFIHFKVVLLPILELLNKIGLKCYLWLSEPPAIDLYENKAYFLIHIICNL